MGCAQSQSSPKPSPLMPLQSGLFFPTPPCPIHSASHPQPLSCAHCMRSNGAYSTYTSRPLRCSSVPVHPHASYPPITAAQITSHWSSKYTQPCDPSASSITHHSDPLSLSALSSPYSLSRHVPVRHKQSFHVDVTVEWDGTAGSGEELSVLNGQLSVFRERRKRGPEGQEGSVASDASDESLEHMSRDESIDRQLEEREEGQAVGRAGGGEDKELEGEERGAGKAVPELSAACPTKRTTSRHLALVKEEERVEEDEDLVNSLQRHCGEGMTMGCGPSLAVASHGAEVA